MNPDRRAALLLHLARRGAPGRGAPTHVVLEGDVALLLEHGLTQATADEVIARRSDGSVEAELARVVRAGVLLSTRDDAEYPAELIGHPYAPLAVYRHGELPPRPRVGIVGARNASSTMIAFTERLGQAAAEHQIAVVSGLARGIDAAAHRGALRGGGGCIGVLGNGLDVVYPPDTRSVRDGVWNRGAMLTTFPLGAAPLPFHFPLRNRLLAAVCDAVVVVQARHDSGSMSTARAAIDVGIDVLVVPGSPEDPLAEGTNSLLKDGARPVLGPRDLVEALRGVGAFQTAERSVDSEPMDDTLTASILVEIGSVARDADSIARATGIDSSAVIARLVELELEGRVIREPGGVFRARKRASPRIVRISSNPLQSGSSAPDEE